MNNLKTPTHDISIVVYCKDHYTLRGKVNIQGYDRFSEFYEGINNLHMYNVRVRFCPINQNTKVTLTPEYICVPKENIIFCFPK